jgi:hypothetical protein
VAVAAAVVAVVPAVVAVAAVVVAADAGKALALHLKQQEAPRCASAAGPLLFCNGHSEILFSFQQSRSPAANARCTHFAIYRTDAAPVWRDHYVPLIRRGTVRAVADSNP